MSGRSRQRACLSITWTSVFLLAVCSAAHGRVIPAEDADELCVGPGCDEIGPAYQVVDDNDIHQDANTHLWEPGDLSIVSEKLSVFQDSNGDYKATDEVKLESDNADGILDSTYTVDLMSQESDNVAKEQKVVYSYPYVFFRIIGVEKKVAGDEDATVKDGNSYILYGNYNEDTDPNGERKSPNVNFHSVSDSTEGEKIFSDLLNNFFKSITGTPNEEPTPAKRSDVNDASSALKIALEVGKELLTNMNEMHKNIDSSSRVSTNSGTFLNGLFREYRSPDGKNWYPWGWKSASESSDDVTNKGSNSYKSPNFNSHSVTEKTEGEEIFRDLLNNFFKSITGTPNEEPAPAKRSDVNDASSALKIALEVGKELLTNMNEMHKNIDSSSRVSTNSGTFLNGLFREYRSPDGKNWYPRGWESASESSDDVTNIDRLLASMISEMVQGSMGLKPTRTSSMPSLSPLTAQKVRLSGAQTSEGLISPELMWLITLM